METVRVAGHALTDISCASAKLCAAVDGRGNVFTSADPGGGRAAWRIAHVDHEPSFDGVSCAWRHLCVAVGFFGAMSSADPTGGAGAWHIAQVDNENTDTAPSAVSCASASLCVAGGRSGKVLSATEPTGETPPPGRSASSMAGSRSST